MQRKYFYAPVAKALEALRAKGYTVDFNLVAEYITDGNHKFHAGDFEITEVYRYEGDSDPGDEATVYGVESNTGLKGTLVTGYGMSSDTISEAMLEKLR